MGPSCRKRLFGTCCVAVLLVPPLAASADDELRCVRPVLEPGQEAALTAMFNLVEDAGAPAMVPTGITAKSQRIEVSYVDSTVRGAASTGLRYVVNRVSPGAQLAPDSGPPLHIERAAPCPSQTTTTVAGCGDEGRQARLRAADARVQRAVLRGADSLRWRCPAGHQGSGSVGARLVAVQAALSEARLADAEGLLDDLLREWPQKSASVAEQVDVATAVRRVRGHLAATPHFQAAIKRWRLTPHAGRWDTQRRADMERVAAAHAALGKRDEGRALLMTCIREHPGPEGCLAGPLADALEARDDWEGASALLDEELQRLHPAPPAFWLARITLAGRHGDAEVALTKARAATQAWPTHSALQRALAGALLRSGGHGEALELLEAQFKRARDRHHVLALIEGVYCDMNRAARVEDGSQAALTRLDEAMKRRAERPDDLVARFLVGLRQLRRGKLAAAIAAMKAVHDALPRATRPLLHLAVAEHWRGQQVAAAAAIEQAIALDPNDPATHHARALLAGPKNPLRARQSLARYLALARQPGRLQFSGQVHRAEAALARLERGETPPALHRPGQLPPRPTAQSLADPMAIPGPIPLSAGLLALLTGGGLGWWWRRRAASGRRG